MEFNKKSILILLALVFSVFSVGAASVEQLSIDISEQVNQNVLFNPLKTGGGIWYDTFENQSGYNLVGYITIVNKNPEGSPMNDIYLSFDFTTNITLPTLSAGRGGTWRSNDPSSNLLVLHIPEILNGENSTWVYSINSTNIRPPLNYTTTYSDYKILGGWNLTVTDKIQNVFDNASFQTDTCIYDINITQATKGVNFSNTIYYFEFEGLTAGTDATNVTYSSDNLTQYWNARNSGCLNKGEQTDINYLVLSPFSIPKSNHYYMTNTTLRYKLNQSISHLRLIDIVSISKANISFEKEIISPSDSILHGSNVTWNVTGYFRTGTSVNFNLSEVTLWVSQRNVNGSYTDPNTVDNDTINTSKPLKIIYNPFTLVNSSQGYSSNGWLFNYSDVPSPIVWMDINFSIINDGVQLINKSVIQNGNDIYVKELYLIIGYWLEIEKNISALGNDLYHIRIDVHNKGNQVTPADSIVTVYDFIPGNFVRTGNFVYSSSPWYTTANASNTVTGGFNGTLVQWALVPTNSLNTSLYAGPAKNVNTTWSVDFNVTGTGDYQVLDVFITGLDPQQVDGAGSTRAVVVSEILDRLKSTEGIFAAVASVLLLLGLLL